MHQGGFFADSSQKSGGLSFERWCPLLGVDDCKTSKKKEKEKYLLINRLIIFQKLFLNIRIWLNIA